MRRSTQIALRRALGLTVGEWRSVIEAAKDAHLDVFAYCRLMVLVAAGHGGVIEHLERASRANWDASEDAAIDGIEKALTNARQVVAEVKESARSATTLRGKIR